MAWSGRQNKIGASDMKEEDQSTESILPVKSSPGTSHTFEKNVLPSASRNRKSLISPWMKLQDEKNGNESRTETSEMQLKTKQGNEMDRVLLKKPDNSSRTTSDVLFSDTNTSKEIQLKTKQRNEMDRVLLNKPRNSSRTTSDVIFSPANSSKEIQLKTKQRNKMDRVLLNRPRNSSRTTSDVLFSPANSSKKDGRAEAKEWTYKDKVAGHCKKSDMPMVSPLEAFIKVKKAKKVDKVWRLCCKHEGAVIVSCLFKSDVDNVFKYLASKDVLAGRLHRDLREVQKLEAEKSFKSHRTRVLVTTVDLLYRMNVSSDFMLVNFDLPVNVTEYKRLVLMAKSFTTFINEDSSGATLVKLYEEGVDMPEFMIEIVKRLHLVRKK